jgi:hypothetical protein
MCSSGSHACQKTSPIRFLLAWVHGASAITLITEHAHACQQRLQFGCGQVAPRMRLRGDMHEGPKACACLCQHASARVWEFCTPWPSESKLHAGHRNHVAPSSYVSRGHALAREHGPQASPPPMPPSKDHPPQKQQRCEEVRISYTSARSPGPGSSPQPRKGVAT